MTVTSVVIAGVGGQGAILASELLALTAMAAGRDVKQGEFHGVAQRGGAVFSHVRFGGRVRSPIARRGEVDFLLALEKLEALRYAHFVRPGGTILVNDFMVEPIRMGDTRPYPEDAADFLAGKGYHAVVIKATDEALALGNFRAANVVLLGALAESLDLPDEAWESTLRARVPERFLDLNQRAFAAGRAHTRRSSGAVASG
jgi:indolepyruvate ferredoxin oxidoreductase beta subunit